MKNRQEALANEPIGKLFIKLSIPAILAQLVNLLYNLVDRIYIGHIEGVGDIALTGVGLTFPLIMFVSAFSSLCGMGGAPKASIAMGENNQKHANRILGNSLVVTITLALILTIVLSFFNEPLLFAFGASENTLPYALAYITPLFTGTICNLFAFGLNNSIRSDGNPKLSMLTMIIGATINLLLDPIFIFGLNLGIKGAAYATILSQFIASCWVLHYFTKSKKSSINITLPKMKLKKHIVNSILMIGLSPFLMQIASSIVSVLANKALMTYGGDLAIGAMAIITSIYSIFIMPIYGLNQGTQPIIGYNYGAKKYDRVRKTYIYGLTCCTIILVLSAIFIQLFPEKAVGMFNNDPLLTNITISGMKLYLLSMPIIGIQMTASNYYQAVGKAKKAMFISLTRQIIFLIPAFLIFPKLFGLTGV